jgi:hypothetical protein
MKYYTIPVRPQTANQSITTTMGGKTYTLRLRWQGRKKTWALTILDSEGQILISSYVLRMRQDILATKRHDPRCPDGVLLLDSDNPAGDANWSDLGTITQIWWTE